MKPVTSARGAKLPPMPGTALAKQTRGPADPGYLATELIVKNEAKGSAFIIWSMQNRCRWLSCHHS